MSHDITRLMITRAIKHFLRFISNSSLKKFRRNCLISVGNYMIQMDLKITCVLHLQTQVIASDYKTWTRSSGYTRIETTWINSKFFDRKFLIQKSSSIILDLCLLSTPCFSLKT